MKSSLQNTNKNYVYVLYKALLSLLFPIQRYQDWQDYFAYFDKLMNNV